MIESWRGEKRRGSRGVHCLFWVCVFLHRTRTNHYDLQFARQIYLYRTSAPGTPAQDQARRRHISGRGFFRRERRVHPLSRKFFTSLNHATVYADSLRVPVWLRHRHDLFPVWPPAVAGEAPLALARDLHLAVRVAMAVVRPGPAGGADLSEINRSW